MPADECYMPLHVGNAGKASIGYQGDDTGDNISTKNSSFCELTGLYWAWKNLDAEYIGMAHYRRHFAKSWLPLSIEAKRRSVIGATEIAKLLEESDVIMPTKRRYWIETTRSQYEHAHNPQDLAIAETIVHEKYPGYVESFNRVMNMTSGHRFNMFIMRQDLFRSYCEWLFDILFELERRADTSDYNKHNSRIFGFVGERLMDVWLDANKINYVEHSVLFMERQNWLVKIKDFLLRKINGGVDFRKE